MIPKKIHYIWFGDNEYSELIKECIKSWKKIMPDYELILWNEENYDIEKNLYIKQAYQEKKFAFVSDYVRLDVLYRYGGIYFDTDVEVFKRFDRFLISDGFTGFEGKKTGINPGIVLGAKKGLPLIKEIMEEYNKPFIKEDGEYDLTTIVHNTTKVLKRHGLIENGKTQNIGNFFVYEKDYFAPDIKNLDRKNLKENNYSAHLYAASWVDSEVQKRMKKPIWKFIGKISFYFAKIGRFFLGEQKWCAFRNKFFKELRDKMTTVK